MENMDNIIKKIQNLLALANSSNENEASLAANMANKLLTKHNLSLQQIQKREKTFGSNRIETGKRRFASELTYVSSLVEEFFFVRIIHSRHRDFMGKLSNYTMLVIGESHNVMIAEYVIEFLSRSFKENFKNYRKATGCPISSKKSYYYGLFAGLHKKLKESVQTVQAETGLVLVPDADLDKHIRDNFNNLKTSKEKGRLTDSAAVQQGKEDGQKINIARGMGGGKPNPSVGQTLKLGDGK